MTRPILLLDMDGPLADFDGEVWDVIQRRRWEVDLESLDDPRRQRFMTDNMPNPAEAQELRRMINTTRWFRDLRPVEGAKDGVAELMELFDIWVCTKPLEANKRCRDDKAQWVETHFPMLAQKLMCVPNKGLVHGNVLLDDAPKIGWMEYATWRPVVFRSVFNEHRHNPWEGLPLWSWGDDPAFLLEHMAPF